MKMSLFSEIQSLIQLHQEGPYWDFKKQWYGKEKDTDQLIDIICMANNLSNRDAYIIIGIDEETDYTICSIENDPNRRNTQMLTEFLKGKKFAGDLRPVVSVESLNMWNGIIDVIVIHNKLDTPYYLKETYKKQIYANHIYVRLQDSNTPRDQSADMNHVEYLWKKRFGLLSTPIERIHLYLQHPEDWVNSPSIEDKKYYKYAPEYTIEHTYEADDNRNGYEYYLFAQTDSRPHWCDIKICYHQTVIEELGGVILDGGRYFTATPSTDGISITQPSTWDVSYKYMIRGNINYLVHEFYYEDDGDEARHAHDEFENCILIFETEEEHRRYNTFIYNNWHKKEEYSEGIWMPYFEEIDGYNMDVIKEEYRNVQILKKMLLRFRTEHLMQE